MKTKATLLILLSAVLVEPLAQSQEAWSPDGIWHELESKDRDVSCGRISYVQSLNGSRNATPVKIVYDDALKFRKSYIYLQKGFKAAFVEKVYDGQDSFDIFQNQVVISSGKPIELDPGMFAVDVAPKPDFPMGRGLSSIKNHKVEIQGNIIVVSGMIDDNSLIKAYISSSDHLLARRIVRFDALGHLIGTWFTSGEISNGRIAASAVYVQSGRRSQWTFQKGDFQLPSSSTFVVPLPPGVLVLDQRLGGSVAIRNDVGHTIYKNEVINVTKRKLKEESLLLNRSHVLRLMQNSVNGLCILLSILVGGVWICMKKEREKRRVA